VSEHQDDLELAAQAAFGSAFPRLVAFSAMLADEGVTRGLIGPREVPRIWERHILNSSAVAPFLPTAGTVMDVGSGAGFPGIVLACMRPDLRVVLLEPMDRRVTWLHEVVSALQLTSTEVVRGRAEDVHGVLSATVATARAVAPMDRLAGWLLPLLDTGGVMLAMKGNRAHDEVEAARAVITHLGGGEPEILRAPTVTGSDSTTVVRIQKVREPSVSSRRRPASRR
jgi:16S rRNA (guanine527-N7)-methyltransferase